MFPSMARQVPETGETLNTPHLALSGGNPVPLLGLSRCCDIMQTFIELIETCINKEPNANPSDVHINASPNVLVGAWCCDIMQTFMELIETCIIKELNANPSDVSINASPNVLPVEAITKAPISTT
jgi:hypothetical protein